MAAQGQARAVKRDAARASLILTALVLAGLAVPAAAHAATRAPSASDVAHSGPYSWTPAVRAPAHGRTGDLITFHGELCRGRTRYVRILAMSTVGGMQTAPGTVRTGHISFRLVFGREDTGSWVIVGITAGCADGSTGAYGGPAAVHPIINVH
jgi:hypothetical protein